MPAPEPGEQRTWPPLSKGTPPAGVAIALDLHLLLRHESSPLYNTLSLNPLNLQDNRRAAILHLGAEFALAHQGHDDAADPSYRPQSSGIRMAAAAFAGRSS
jgi:hypothetical protein